MADDELQAIRAQRMAAMRQQQQQNQGDPNQAAQKQEDERKQQEDMKNSILSQVLNQSARARLNTIRIAKPEKAAMVENLLVNMARRGQIGGQLGENELKGLLEQVSQQTKQETTVKFDRRRAALDDEDDD
uniref:Programmed cell death protein 5 n=1 Tax=Daphnia galeata TaxID=27404 RepID=A0A8J2RVK5_9CRUS|nr:unnamed protein product [Daphnia galeata]